MKLRGLVAIFLLISLCCAVLRYETPVIAAVTASNGGTHVLSGPSYEVMTEKGSPNWVTLTLDYAEGQNTSFAIELMNGCISGVGIISKSAVQATPAAVVIPKFCHEGVLNLASQLKEGLNEIVMRVEKDENIAYSDSPNVTRMTIAPVLLGTHWFSTACCLILFMFIGLAAYAILIRSGLNRTFSLIAVAGMAYYALWLHVRPNTLYTADMPDHIHYVLSMMRHWWQPYTYNGGENHQPPFYYIATALFIDWFGYAFPMSPLTMARMFSLVLYMTLVAYGLRTLQESCRIQSALYYLGAVLLVFWPVAVDMATNINNDFGVYAPWAAGFFYLTRWYRERALRSLALAIFFTGVALLMKSTSFILLGTVAIAMLLGLFTRRLSLRQLFTKPMLLAGVALALGGAGSVGKLIYSKLPAGQAINTGGISYLYFAGVSDKQLYPLHYYLTFNPWAFISDPFSAFLNEPGFLNYFLKTTLYSQWNHPENFLGLANAINFQLVLFLALLVAGAIVLFIRERPTAGDMVLMVVHILVCIAGLLTFTYMHADEFCQSMRYVYPILIPLVVLFVRGLEAARGNHLTRWLYWLGVLLGITFPLSGIFFYLHFQPVT